MLGSGKQGRQARVRAFRPRVAERLEERVVLSSAIHSPHVSYAFLLKHPKAKAAYFANVPPFVASNAPPFPRHFKKKTEIATQTARGGQNVEVTALDGSHYMISLSYTSNTLATNAAEGLNGQEGAASTTAVDAQVAAQATTYPQPIGTVRAYPMSGGRVGIIVDGSTPNTELTVNPLGQQQRKGYAQSFAYGETLRGHVLNIGQLTVTSGEIGDILGFQDAELSGPLTAVASTSIDRIAFDEIEPGASITTGGDVNTLDVLNGVDLSGAGTGISIGRDLNLLNVGGNLTLSDGATFKIGRNLGLVSQPPKGTGTGSNVLTLNFNSIANTTVTVVVPPSVGSFIQGSLNIDTASGSAFLIGSQIYNTMYIEGSIAGFSGLLINTSTAPTSPPFESKLINNPQGYVTALGGETG